MPRIAGINLNDNKQIVAALTTVFGIGFSLSEGILKQAQITPTKKVKDLTEEEIDKIRQIIEKNHKVEGDLKSQVAQNVKRLKEIGSYRGERHIRNLPVRGQRTKTNARTKRGKRITVGSGRKSSSEKT
jgi:small subunit ribosomal protein S13